MAIVHKSVLERNITAQRDSDILFGVRGGILLSLDLTWAPITYFNLGTEDEVVRSGDIHVLVLDLSTLRSPIGQIAVSGPSADSIVVRTATSWGWKHPEAEALESSDMVGRMAFNSGFTQDPIGVLRSGLRLQVKPDPNNVVPHSLLIEAKFLAFDSAVL